MPTYTAPPGEEGLDLSYEGGEFEAFDGLSEQVASLSGWYVPITFTFESDS